MKRLPFAILASLIVLLGSWGLSYAATSVFLTTQGGTGTSSPSGILYGDNGATSHLNTVTLGANCTFVGGVLNCTSAGVTSISQTYGTSQTGAVTLATTTGAFDGVTLGINITNSAGVFTFQPTMAGTVGVRDGGTGITTVSNGSLLYGSGGTSPLSTLATTTGAGRFLSQDYATGLPSWVATSSLGVAISDTTGTLSTTRGGTGITSYTLGDTLYASAANTLSALPGNTTTAQLFLSQTGTGSASAAPSWQAIPIAGSKSYYAYATQATSSSAYYNMNPTASTTSSTVAYPLTTSPQTVQNWITPAGDPGVTSIPGGTYIVDLFAWRSSGSASITLAVQVWEVSSTGADVSLIGTTNSTPNLTGSKAQYNLAFTTGTHAMASVNDRILMRVVATTSGTPTLSLAMGDGDQMDLVTPGATVDTSNFVPYTGATKNLDLGAFNASTTQLTVVGPEWITSLGTPAGSILAVDPNGKIIATTTSSGTVTSVSGSGGTTGLTLTGGPITTSGTLTLGGTLGIANGGTGTTTGGVTNGVEYYNGTTLTNGRNFIFDGTNVGIGTTTPVAKLSVNGAIHAFGQFLASSTDSALLPGYSWLGDLTTGMFHPLQSVIAWAIGGVEQMRLTSIGLGIGSTTPTVAISVGSGTASSSATIAEYAYGKGSNVATSTAYTFGPNLASNHIVWPIGTAATTFTLCMEPGQTLTIRVLNPNASAGAITWAACSGEQLYWTTGTVPTQTTTANNWDIWSFIASQTVGSTSNAITISGAQTPTFH